MGNILLYDEKGRLITSTSIGASFTSDGSVFRFNDFITSTGLQIKSDPGIGIIYSSFIVNGEYLCKFFQLFTTLVF